MHPHIDSLPAEDPSLDLAAATRVLAEHPVGADDPVAWDQDGDATAGAFDRKLEVIRDAAGSRFEELEFNTLVQEVIVTDDAAGAAAKLIGDWKLGVDEILESPLLLIGTGDQIRQKLRRIRDRLRISYVTVFEKNMEAMAPVIEPLLGS